MYTYIHKCLCTSEAKCDLAVSKVTHKIFAYLLMKILTKILQKQTEISLR